MEQQDYSGAVAAGSGILMLVYLAIAVLLIASMWRMFTKAGKPGWAAIVPIYNVVVMLEMVGRPVWWLVLFCVPFVNAVVGIIVTNDIAKAFGKGVGYTIGLILLSFVFYPMLAFGPATYRGPVAAPGMAA